MIEWENIVFSALCCIAYALFNEVSNKNRPSVFTANYSTIVKNLNSWFLEVVNKRDNVNIYTLLLKFTSLQVSWVILYLIISSFNGSEVVTGPLLRQTYFFVFMTFLAAYWIRNFFTSRRINFSYFLNELTLCFSLVVCTLTLVLLNGNELYLITSFIYAFFGLSLVSFIFKKSLNERWSRSSRIDSQLRLVYYSLSSLYVYLILKETAISSVMLICLSLVLPLIQDAFYNFLFYRKGLLPINSERKTFLYLSLLLIVVGILN